MVAGWLGRVLVGGKDCGAGFALGPRLVVTANHVVRGSEDKPVTYVPTGGEAIDIARVQPDVDHDAAILWLASDIGEYLRASAAMRGAQWWVESPPPGANEPVLHGTVTTARTTIQKREGQRVEVVQLEADEDLGDFSGYSGSAVLDSLGRAVALLVEQKPLRTAVPLGQRPTASNVLYAVPIGDVIIACGLPVRTSRPLRFDVGLLPPGIVTRLALLDEAVSRVIGAEGGETSAGLVLLRGPGGAGKTVVARQVADDPQVWAEFVDGIIMLRAGQTATADSMARQLQEALGYRDRHPADLLAGQRLLLIIDDIWDPELLGTLRANLPPTVTVLATTRGVSVPGGVVVHIGAVGLDEAIQILARNTPRSIQLDQALGNLAETLFRWPLLLTLAAAEIHRDDELEWGLDDEYDSRPQELKPSVVIELAEKIQEEFPDDLTMLDDLTRTPKGAAPRSVAVLVRRSLEWLSPESQARFQLLVLYPPGAAITQPMLEDLWDVSQNAARKEIKLLVLAGLAQPIRSDRLTIELHDLITAWLHHTYRCPNDVRHQPVHQRLSELCLRSDGSPGKLTKDRAEWLVYHLVAARAWDRLEALPTLRWRRAFLVATASDATFLADLDHYGQTALAQAPDAVYHAVRAWLFAAHVRALIGQLPVPLLVAMALIGDPIAGVIQACQHPRAGEAVPEVLAAVTDRLDARLLLKRALALADAIPDDFGRSRALAAIAEQLAAADPPLIDQAMAVASTIPRDFERSKALAAIAEQLAAADPPLIDQARAVVRAIPDWGRGGALATIAERLAAAAPSDLALIDRALAVARTIPDDEQHCEALSAIAKRLAAAASSDPALIERALAVANAIPDWGRGEALAAIAEQLAASDPRDPALIDQAVAVAHTIPDGWQRSRVMYGDIPGRRQRSEALAAIARQLAAIDPDRTAALIEEAVAAVDIILDDWHRSRALSSIAERLAAADPPDLALIDRALAVARTVRDDWHRSEALAAIARRLAAIDPPRTAALIEEAVAAADTIPEDVGRDEALIAVAERLAAIDPPRTAALIDRALALASAIPDNIRRGMALAAIVKRLAAVDPPDPVLIDRALTVADAIPNDWTRTWILADVARRLAVIDPPRTAALIDRALARTDTISNDERRCEALTRIIGRLAAADPTDPALIARVLAMASTIPRGWERGKALTAIAERLALATQPDLALIDQTLALADAIPDDAQRTKALADIARQLAAADPPDPALIDRALALTGTIPDDWQRSEALTAIARQLAAINPLRTAALIDQTLAQTGTISRDWQRSEVLATIAERLAAADPPDPALIDQALAVADTIPDDGQRSMALAAIARQLAAIDPNRTAALIDQTLDLADTIPDDWTRSRALAAIARQLAVIDPDRTAALIDQTLDLADTIPDDGQRSMALAAIARQLAAGDPPDLALIDRALAAADTIPDDYQRTMARSDIAKRLVTDPPDPALIDPALALADTIPDGRQRGWALGDIIERLSLAEPPDPVLIHQVLATARAIPDDWQRSEALAAIAPRLIIRSAQTAPTVDQALALASAIPRDWQRSQALAWIAERLAAIDASDPSLIDQALAVASTIPDDRQRSDALAQIHGMTSSSMLDELSRWRLRPLDASIDLLTAFLKDSRDKTIAESISRAVLEVAAEFSVKT